MADKETNDPIRRDVASNHDALPKCPVTGVAIESLEVKPWRQSVLSLHRQHTIWDTLTGIAVAALLVLYIAYWFVPNTLIKNLVTTEGIVAIIVMICTLVLQSRWEKKIFFFTCDCGKRIGTNVDWTCGQCNREHRYCRAKYSFLYKCRRCGESPPAFICYHCGRVIRLAEKGEFRHPAYATKDDEEIDEQFADKLKAADRRKQAFDKEIQVLKAERAATMTAKELEEAKRELEQVTSSEFSKRMNDIERFALGDAEIIQAGADEEDKIMNDPRYTTDTKKRTVDRLRLYVRGKLNARKPT